MDINAIDNFFLTRQEPDKGCFLALREIIKNWSPKISEHWKYSVPFYYFEGKPFCYLYRKKDAKYPYIGLVRTNQLEHPDVLQGNRKKMKVMPINPEEDIPIQAIHEIFEELSKLY